jgi:hypothetical protein
MSGDARDRLRRAAEEVRRQATRPPSQEVAAPGSLQASPTGEDSGDDALRSLLPLLADPFEDVRRGAAEVLGELGDSRASERLVEALGDVAESVRATAGRALAAMWPASRAALVGALGRPSSVVRNEAANALDIAGWSPAGAGERAQNSVARGDWHAAAAEGEAGIEPLVSALPTVRGAEVCELLRALAGLGVGAVGPLAKRLRHPDPSVRRLAADALGEIERREALPLLRARLRVVGGEPDSVVAGAIRQAIYRIERTTRSLQGLPQSPGDDTASERLPRPAE